MKAPKRRQNEHLVRGLSCGRRSDTADNLLITRRSGDCYIIPQKPATGQQSYKRMIDRFFAPPTGGFRPGQRGAGRRNGIESGLPRRRRGGPDGRRRSTRHPDRRSGRPALGRQPAPRAENDLAPVGDVGRRGRQSAAGAEDDLAGIRNIQDRNWRLGVKRRLHRGFPLDLGDRAVHRSDARTAPPSPHGSARTRAVVPGIAEPAVGSEPRGEGRQAGLHSPPGERSTHSAAPGPCQVYFPITYRKRTLYLKTRGAASGHRSRKIRVVGYCRETADTIV